MPSVEINITGVQETLARLDKLKGSIDAIVEGLAYATDVLIIPELQSRSSNVWGVRSGRYSTGWYRMVIGADALQIRNDAPYASSLEYGWRTRGGKFKPSAGVAMPTIMNNREEIRRLTERWLKTRAGL